MDTSRASHIDFTLDKLRRFKFTLKTARELDAAARRLGCDSFQALMSSGATPDAIALLVCYGLKWEDHKMTEARAEAMTQTFIDSGGDVEELFDKLTDALVVSGIYKRQASATPDADANPSQA